MEAELNLSVRYPSETNYDTFPHPLLQYSERNTFSKTHIMAFRSFYQRVSRVVANSLRSPAFILAGKVTHTRFSASSFTSLTTAATIATIAVCAFTSSANTETTINGKKCRVCRDLGGSDSINAMSMHDFLKMKPLAVVKAAAQSDPQTVMEMTPEEYQVAFKDYTPPTECPPNYWELGQATWTYLHTMAAYYPENPSAKLQASMPSFIHTFAEIYPCESCRDHMIQYVEKNPPRVKNNIELSLWFCEFHNDVNRTLGKPPVPCNAKYLIERWRDGPEDGQCD